MKNPFKEILQSHELPEVLKQKILDDVSAVKLTIDMADLFLVKYPSTVGDIVFGGECKKNDK